MRNYNFLNKQSGVSLIELMLAMVLGIIVIFGVTQSLISMSQSSRVQSRNAELLETADTALSYLSFRARNSLSTPCERYSKLHSSGLTIQGLAGDIASETITPTQAAAIQNLINGFGITITPRAVARNFGSTYINYNTDDITLVSIGERLFPTTDVTFMSKEVEIGGTFATSQVGNKTLYAITDCKKMDVFRAKRVEESGATKLKFMVNAADPTKSTDIKAAYRIDDLSIVSPLDIAEISVTDDGRLIDKTVFRDNSGSLMNNVDLIRVLIGVDNTQNGIIDQYITAPQIDDLDNTSTVISADIYLLVKASNADTSIDSSYDIYLPDTTVEISGGNSALPQMEKITITDKIQRKVFMRSIAFRNNAITL